MAGNTFYQQQAANKRNSLLMAGFIVLLLGLLGFSIGYAIFGTPAGGVGTTITGRVGLDEHGGPLLQRKMEAGGAEEMAFGGHGGGGTRRSRLRLRRVLGAK